jgi:bacteriorhodopsin
LICGVWTIFLWFIYPIAWGLCEGGNVISPDSEAVFYGVLDILAKPVFGALLLFGHRNIDPAALGLNIRDYEDEITPHEKVGHHNTTGVVNNGTTHDTTTTGAPVSTGVNNNTSAV